MFAFALNPPRPIKSQYPILKGRVRLRKVPFLFSLFHHLDYYFGALFVREPMLHVMEECQPPRAGLFHLLITRLPGGFQLCFLFFTYIRRLNLRINPITHLAIGDHCRHRCLKLPHPFLNIVRALRHSIDMRPTFMMPQGPI